jgi:hypothetical protein
VIPVVTGDKAAAQASIATEKELRTKAEQGDQEAQYLLGLKYSKGDGVATNRIEGYKWLHIAVESGNTNALLARWETGKSMTPDEIAQATRLASAVPLPGTALAQGNSHSPVSTKKPESKRTPSEILTVLRSSKSEIRVGPTADIVRWQADVENQKTDRVLRLGGGDGLFFVSDVKSALGEPDKITVEDAPGFSNSNTGEQLKGDVFWYGRVGLGFTPFSTGDFGPGLFYLRYQPAGTNKAATDVQLSPTHRNWPKYSGELLGRMEVRVTNPNEFRVRVGLRSDGKGRDFNVEPNATEFVRVPNGRYDIYFQYSSDPDGLYQGDSFTLKGNGAEIQIVKVVNGNYGIRKVK